MGARDGDDRLLVKQVEYDEAKVSELLKAVEWTDIDLGPLAATRVPEMCMALRVRLWGALQSGNININVQR